MYSFVAGRPGDPRVTDSLLDAMFRLRHGVFNARRHWEVHSRNGRERDTYDELDPVYVIGYAEGSGAVAISLRMLPTTGAYMLRDVFPQALRGAPGKTGGGGDLARSWGSRLVSSRNQLT